MERTNLPIREVMNKENICASFSVAPRTAKVTAIAHDKVLMKAEKNLKFRVEDMNRRGYPLTATCYGKKP